MVAYGEFLGALKVYSVPVTTFVPTVQSATRKR